MPTTSALVTPLSQFQAVCENATAALFVMDERHHCIYMNKSAEQLTGYTVSEVQGRHLHDFIHHTRPDGRAYPLDECPIDRAAPQENQEQGEEVFVHKDGHFYPVAFTARPIRHEHGVVGTVLEARCISEQKRREREDQALRVLSQGMLAEVELESVVQSATDVATELTGAQFGAFFYNVTDADGARYTLYTLSGIPREAFSHKRCAPGSAPRGAAPSPRWRSPHTPASRTACACSNTGSRCTQPNRSTPPNWWP